MASEVSESCELHGQTIWTPQVCKELDFFTPFKGTLAHARGKGWGEMLLKTGGWRRKRYPFLLGRLGRLFFGLFDKQNACLKGSMVRSHLAELLIVKLLPIGPTNLRNGSGCSCFVSRAMGAKRILTADLQVLFSFNSYMETTLLL